MKTRIAIIAALCVFTFAGVSAQSASDKEQAIEYRDNSKEKVTEKVDRGQEKLDANRAIRTDKVERKRVVQDRARTNAHKSPERTADAKEKRDVTKAKQDAYEQRVRDKGKAHRARSNVKVDNKQRKKSRVLPGHEAPN